MASKRFSKDDAFHYKYTGTLTDKFSHNLSDVKFWGKGMLYSEGLVPAIYIRISDDNEKLSLEVVNQHVKGIRSEIGEIASNKVNAVLDEVGDRPVKEVILDRHFSVCAYSEEYGGPFYCLTLEDVKFDWQKLNFRKFAEFARGGKNEGHHTILWRVGDVMMKNSTSWLYPMLASIIVEDYCDTFIPLTDPAKSDVAFSKVTKEAFVFLSSYLWKIVYGNTKSLPLKNIETTYKELDDNSGIPFVPVKWNDEHTEEMNVSKIQTIIDNFLASKEDDEDTDDTIKSLKQVNEVLENATGKVLDTKTINNFDQIQLSELLSGNFLEKDIVHSGEIYTVELKVDVDCDIVVNDDLIIPSELIPVATLIYGVLSIIIPDGVLSREEIKEIESKMAEERALGMFINTADDIDDIVDKWSAYLTEREKTNA